MQLYLAAAPDELERCLPLTNRVAHAAFRVGEDGALLLRPMPETLRGGFLLLDCSARFPAAAAPQLARDILRHCVQRNFSGVVLDGFDSATPERSALCGQLQPLCRRYHRTLYVPTVCADDAPQAFVLLCTALSGGTLTQYLRESVECWGPQRIALDLQRLQMEFPLPCPDGEGTSLSQEQLRQRITGRSVYYSDALCARYCTCRSQGQYRFVLFDDADTLQRKIKTAQAMGITQGFFTWGEVADIAEELPWKKKEAEP